MVADGPERVAERRGRRADAVAVAAADEADGLEMMMMGC